MLQTTIFYNDYDNILGRATLAGGTDGSGDLFNGGAVEVRGLELSADYEPVPVRSLRFPVRMAYTYTDARFGTSFESSFAEWGEVEEGDRLPYLPTHQLSAAASAATDRWSLGLSASAASAMRTVAGTGSHPDGTGTDAHFVVNASVEYRATPQATLHGGVQNIFDRRYIVARRPAGARPGLPRTVAIGVRVELN